MERNFKKIVCQKKITTTKILLEKMGSYAAFAALGTMIILNPQKAQAVSGPPNLGFWGLNSNVRGVRVDRNKK